MERSKKDGIIFVRAEEPLIERLELAARLTDSTISRLTREALREKLAQLSIKHPELAPPAIGIAVDAR